MLGEKIGGTAGKITSQRVLPNLGGDPKMGSAEQDRSRIRIRGRRRGQHALRILGMEVNTVWFLDAEAFHRNALQHLCFIRVNLWQRNLRDLPSVQAGTPDGE